MSDNTTLNPGTGGDVYASDDIAGVKYQRVKLVHGIDGVNDGDIAATNPLPVAAKLIDEAGAIYGIKHSNGKPRVCATPYLYDIALGNLPGHDLVIINGRNPDIDNTMEDVWEIGGLYVFPPAGGIQLSIQSTSAADAATGTGARTVDIDVLLADFTPLTITITLTGTTPVLTSQANILRVNRFHVMTAGTGGVAAGNITIKNVAQTITYGQISTGLNSQRQVIYTVPAGKNLYITAWKYHVGASATGKYAEFLLRAQTSDDNELTAVFHIKDESSYVDGGTTIVLPAPIKILATADVRISAISDSANANAICIAGFSGWVE